ncbi:hypothetical protein B0H14DRAFT_3504805 [Mycena olivaceomarginata]|nr:hypothetical protein B0H14DRAFT_3504805 [Mycena olivaceomarginata]
MCLFAVLPPLVAARARAAYCARRHPVPGVSQDPNTFLGMPPMCCPPLLPLCAPHPPLASSRHFLMLPKHHAYSCCPQLLCANPVPAALPPLCIVYPCALPLGPLMGSVNYLGFTLGTTHVFAAAVVAPT